MNNSRYRKPERNGRTNTMAAGKAPKDYNAWQFPDGLYPLRDWLAYRRVDVGSLKTARQTLMMAVSLSGRKFKLPKRGEEFPALVRLQLELTGARPPRPNPMKSRKHTSKLGTFGAASEVRQIDPNTLLISE